MSQYSYDAIHDKRVMGVGVGGAAPESLQSKEKGKRYKKYDGKIKVQLLGRGEIS